MIKRFVLLLLLFTVILLESSVWPFPFTLLLIVILGLLMGDSGYIYAFFTGLTLDIFTLRPLGVDSLIFLAVCFIVRQYQKKVNTVNYLYVFLFTGIILLLYQLYFYRYVNLLNIIFLVTGSFLSLKIIARFFPEIIADKKKINV